MRTPPFWDQLQRLFASATSNQFLLTGTIHDLVDASSIDDGGEIYRPFEQFLVQRLRSRHHIPVLYDVGRGVRIPDSKDRRALREAYARGDSRKAATFDAALKASVHAAGDALTMLGELTRLPTDRPVSVVILYAELLLPAAEPAQMTDADRRRLALMRDWLSDPRFLEHNGAVFLVAETTAGVNTRLRSLPHLVTVDVPLPDNDERRRFIRWLRKRGDVELALEEDELVRMSAGMTLTDLRGLFADARYRKEAVEHRDVLAVVNRLIRARIGDHIELLEPQHTLDAVVGQQALKTELERQRILLAGDDPELCPVGILVAGPNGTGKTFTFEAWAGTCGRLVVVLKNLRGSYFGETDRIFEQVRQVLEALGNCIILIDEADTQFSSPGKDSHDTEQRLFGNLIRMMGDPRNRGRLVWVLITARPQRLAPDLKRSGRAGLHLPVFDPEGPDRDAFVDHVLATSRIELDDDARSRLLTSTRHCSPADFHELTQMLRAEEVLTGGLDSGAVERVLADYRPADLTEQRREQTIQAVRHCSRRSLIPLSLRGLAEG